MKPKEEAILFFLLKYGILITFEDQSYSNYNRKIISEEAVTFRDWKENLFNDPNVSICIHFPKKMHGCTALYLPIFSRPTLLNRKALFQSNRLYP
jgi:hypothetical protein